MRQPIIFRNETLSNSKVDFDHVPKEGILTLIVFLILVRLSN